MDELKTSASTDKLMKQKKESVNAKIGSLKWPRQRNKKKGLKILKKAYETYKTAVKEYTHHEVPKEKEREKEEKRKLAVISTTDHVYDGSPIRLYGAEKYFL